MFKTLAETLDAAAGGRGHIGFIEGADTESRLSYAALRRAALQRLAVLQHAGAEPGDPLLLFVDDNRRFLEWFWAAQYGGLVPVPIAAGGAAAHLDKLLAVWRHLGEPRVIVEPGLLERLRRHLEAAHDAGRSQRLAERALADCPPAVADEAVPVVARAGDTAFIQFSSGSTGAPKGVVLSHANVLANIAAIAEGSAFESVEVALSWMPLTHDMGLIGFHLTLVALGFDHHLMPTELFARRPLLWLEKASEKQATLLCSPNFGYRHTLRAIAARGLPPVDLSAVRRIYNGAEPIAPGLAREFLDRLAGCGLDRRAMFGVYGLAEASLAAAFPAPGTGLTTISVARGELGVGDAVRPAADEAEAIELVRLGSPVAGCDIRLADAQGAAVAEHTVGRVWIRGDNVTAGYHDNPAANAAAQVGDGWLDTGDLGFFDSGELVITGRAKEIIFVNGQNHYPQDLEALAVAVDGVDMNKVAAVGVRPPAAEADELWFFVVFRGALEAFVAIATALTREISHRTGLVVRGVLPVQQMPKTTSGKLQRAALGIDLAGGRFDETIARLQALRSPDVADEPAPAEDADIEAELMTICAEVMPDRSIARDEDLFESELSSLELAQIHERIEARWPDRLELTDLFDYPTIAALAEVIDEKTAA